MCCVRLMRSGPAPDPDHPLGLGRAEKGQSCRGAPLTGAQEDLQKKMFTLV